MSRINRIAWLFLIPSLIVAVPADAYNLGNYRRDMDEANRQRMSAEFRRDAQISSRRNDELRDRNAYTSPSSSGSGGRSGNAGGSSRGGSSYSQGGGESGAPAIESTTTVTVRVKETEPETAQRILKEAAAGEVVSQWNAGRLYFTGGYGGVARDDAKAAQWFRKAAEAGHAEAALAYGEMAFSGKGVAENPGEAARWFRFAAEKGLPRAMFFWGTFLETGYATARDDQAAFGWLKKAAEQKESYAYASLGNMYDDGRGTPVNPAEAVKWLRLATEQGDASAFVDLGGLYLQGKGVQKDEVEAGKLFLKAAEGGNKNGMINVAVMYEKGLYGVSRDIQKAIHWFGKAGAAGSQEAQQVHDRLAAAYGPAASAASIAGRYLAQGKNPDGSIYTCEVTIEQLAKGYRFTWKFPSMTMRGTGDFSGDKLVIDWGDAYPVIYTLAGEGRLVGTWSNGRATESLSPVR